MPAYNAAKTLSKTVAEIPRGAVDEILLVDDASSDQTVELANELGLTVFLHDANFGYGRNQKTCYREAMRHGADIIVMLHPDYQYPPQLIVPMASMIAYGEYDVVIGSRILGKGAIAGGMPVYKFVANRCLTLIQNILLGYKMSEYHTGFRAFRSGVLDVLPFDANSDDFVFDNQLLTQVIYHGFHLGEISCPTRYFAEASSINFSRSVRYGIGVLTTSLRFRMQRIGWLRSVLFEPERRKQLPDYYREIENIPERRKEA
jgi:glycosyltransferase involved in cell wall biosynthesis